MRLPRFLILVEATMFGLSLAAGSAAGQTILYVDDTATGANNGSSWANAFQDLQDSLDAVSTTCPDVTQIWVAAGTYKPDPTGLVDPREATFQLANCVELYGGFPNGGGNWGDRDPSGAVNETILSGDIGTPGDDSDNSYHVVTGSSTDATAVVDGFMIAAGNADPGGAGLDSQKYGGGMYNNSGSPTVTNCTFSGNRAVERGGGMYNDNNSPTVSHCTFSSNSTDSSGGGIYNTGSNPTIIHCAFEGNTAYRYGGGIYDFGGSSVVANCTFIENTASEVSKGGGMYNWGGYSTILNCTFGGNTADGGGGVYTAGNGTTTLRNCILWDNTVGALSGVTNVVTYSCVQGGYTGTGNTSDDPLFVAGPGGDYYLSQVVAGQGGDSPCVDAGNGSANHLYYSGTTRTDGVDDAGTVDMGYHYSAEWVWRGDLDGDTDVDGNDFLTFSLCFNGSLKPPLSGCENWLADINLDGDCDGNDFLTFSICFNGSLNPPNCP